MRRWIVYMDFTDGSKSKRSFISKHAAEVFYDRAIEEIPGQLLDLVMAEWTVIKSGWK